MITYVIGVLLMIKILRVDYPDVTRPWYADKASVLGTFKNIELYFNF